MLQAKTEQRRHEKAAAEVPEDCGKEESKSNGDRASKGRGDRASERGGEDKEKGNEEKVVAAKDEGGGSYLLGGLS